MSSYRVVLEGKTLPGFTSEVVSSRLAALVNQSEEVAAKLLAGQPSTVKSGLDQATGTRYVNALMQIGVACHVEREPLDIEIGERNANSGTATPHGIGADSPISKAETQATPRLDKASIFPAANGPENRLRSTGQPKPSLNSALIGAVDNSAPGIADNRRVKLYLASIFVIGLAIGYFAGREHIKYEMRSAFKEAAEGLTKGLGAAFGKGESGGKPSPQEPKKKTAEYPIKAKLTKKGFHSGEYGQNAITFSLSFSNATGKNVRAFDGVLTFTDLLENEILSSKLAINDPVTAGAALDWEGKLDYNQFISRHERLRNEELQNIRITFSPRRILFEDGTTKEFNQ